MLRARPQSESLDDAAIVEDAELGPEDRIEHESPEEAGHEAYDQQRDRRTPLELRARPAPDRGADDGRKDEVGDVAGGNRCRQATPCHVQRPPGRHARNGGRELCIHRPVIGGLDPRERDRGDAHEQERVRAASAEAQEQADGHEESPADVGEADRRFQERGQLRHDRAPCSSKDPAPPGRIEAPMRRSRRSVRKACRA